MVEILASITKAFSVPVDNHNNTIWASKFSHLPVNSLLQVFRDDTNGVSDTGNYSGVIPDVFRGLVPHQIHQLTCITLIILHLLFLAFGDVFIAEVDEVLVEIHANGQAPC